jgi:hypothetical protein
MIMSGAGAQTGGRIAAWPPWLSRAVLVLAAVLALSVVFGPQLSPLPAGKSTASSAAAKSASAAAAEYTDRELYREITGKVAAGQDYYASAVGTQRARGYPTWPAWTVREPTEAWLLVLLRADAVRWGVLAALAAGAVVAMRQAVDQVPAARWRRVMVTVLFGAGLAIVAVPTAPYLHENWAALFVGLSLACWRPGDATGAGGGRWGLSVAFGLLACLFREIALPYMVAMAAFAAFERRWAELAGWAAGLAVLAGALGLHFALAARQHLPTDGFSPGWVRFAGWPFAVLASQRNIFLAVLPAPLASLVLLASLLGLASVRSPWLWRIAGVITAFLLSFMAVGRPDNFYWGMIFAPLLAMGLPFAPEALADLVRSALGRRPAVSSAV